MLFQVPRSLPSGPAQAIKNVARPLAPMVSECHRRPIPKLAAFLRRRLGAAWGR
jgi:hypothetical protein